MAMGHVQGGPWASYSPQLVRLLWVSSQNFMGDLHLLLLKKSEKGGRGLLDM